jgi:lipopolysaccharide transport system ATP-binding protein
MIMDEVLAVGDVAFQRKCLTKMREAAEKEGRTVLYVSHNMNTIRQLCDRCVVLEHGHVIFDGDTETAISFYIQSSETSGNLIDLSTMPRSNMFSDPTVRMEQLSIEAESSFFRTGAVLTASLRVKAARDFQNVILEIPVRSNSNISVTRFTSAPTISLSADSVNEIRFTLDVSHLAPGQYSLSPVLRTVTDWKTQLHLDGIVDAYIFQINPTESFNNGVEWNTYYSGYYVAPRIELLQ